MARSDEDIFSITINLQGSLSLDWERIMDDPVWDTIIQLQDGPLNYQAALVEYIIFYLRSEKLLTNMPGTNGPGILELRDIGASDGGN
jgi:hypothetical protein